MIVALMLPFSASAQSVSGTEDLQRLPIASISLNKSPLSYAGEHFNVSWNSSNALLCSVYYQYPVAFPGLWFGPEFSGTSGIHDDYDTYPDTLYRIDCVNGYGSVSAYATQSVAGLTTTDSTVSWTSTNLASALTAAVAALHALQQHFDQLFRH